MIGAKLGHFLDKPLSPILKRIRIHPNIFTLTGFMITAIAAVVIPYNIKLGGLLILAGGLFDMLDGISARVNNKITKFGAFLDSLLDRYSDAFLFLSTAWYLASKGEHTAAFLSLGTLIGAFLISYARARAEGLGEECKTGIMERPERIILLICAALTGWFIPVL
ncbi:MAG: CDP-alcohol phosphatidyltransferase family protein, partial [Thermodesulfovibrionales bacterium]|nr:CDP-alcohol phosphatidyltransferase family protein [Thermodesulfovibrionales bacterium]